MSFLPTGSAPWILGFLAIIALCFVLLYLAISTIFGLLFAASLDAMFWMLGDSSWTPLAGDGMLLRWFFYAGFVILILYIVARAVVIPPGRDRY